MKTRELFFAVALFLSSAGGLIIEIVAGRLIAPYVGMSLYTWTAIIAVVLAGLSVGHWIGGLMAGSRVTADTASRRLAAALALAGVTSLASLVLLRVLSGPLMTSGFSPVAVVVLLSTALFLLPSLFVGIVAPILTKLAIDARPDEPGHVLGRMFAIGTLGSIAGTLGAGYFFISWLGSIGTVLVVAATYFVLAALFALTGRLTNGRWTGAALAILVTGTGVAVWGDRVAAFKSPCTHESDYFCIRIDDFTSYTGRPSALMALDHLVHSINDRDDPQLLYSPYIHFVDEYRQKRFADRSVQEPFSAFFIGGGGFSLPRAWADAMPKSRLVVAEIDPAVTALARDAMWLNSEHPAFNIRHEDARSVLQSLPAEPSFDVVFGDAFHDISVPAHLVTREFHGEIAKRLRPGGFYTINVVDHGGEPIFLAALVHTLGLDFNTVEVWVGDEEMAAVLARKGQRVTYIVVAGNSGYDRNRLFASNGIDEHWVKWPVSSLMEHAGNDIPVLTDDFAPVDRLMSRLMLAPEEL